MKRLFGLAGLFGLFFASGTAFAAESAAAPFEGAHWYAIAAGLGMAIGTFGGALGQARALAAAVEGIARNPGAQMKVFIPLVVGLALIESLVLFTFVIANTIAGKI